MLQRSFFKSWLNSISALALAVFLGFGSVVALDNTSASAGSAEFSASTESNSATPIETGPAQPAETEPEQPTETETPVEVEAEPETNPNLEKTESDKSDSAEESEPNSKQSESEPESVEESPSEETSQNPEKSDDPNTPENEESKAPEDSAPPTSGNKSVGTASISGRVTLPSGFDSEVLSQIFATIEGYDNYFYDQVRTDSNGNYQLDSIPSGKYTLRFEVSNQVWSPDLWNYYHPNLLSVFYGGTRHSNQSTVLTVEDGEVKTGVDIEMFQGSIIKGKVSLPSGVNKSAFSSIRVSAIPFGSGEYEAANSNNAVDSNGNYTIERLWDGDYKVVFERDDSNGNFPITDTWYGGGRSAIDSKAKIVTVPSIGTVVAGKNVTMIKGGSVSGKITLPKGFNSHDYGGVTVTIWDSKGNYLDSVEVGTDGKYSVSGLYKGNYKLSFSSRYIYLDGEEYFPNLIGGWYGGGTSFNSSKSSWIKLNSDGSNAKNINFTMAKGATISGKINLPDGVSSEAYKAIRVEAIGSDYNGSWTRPDSSGNYTLVALEKKSYKVLAEIISDWYDYETDTYPVRDLDIPSTWYGGGNHEYSPDAVSVKVSSNGQNITGKNINLLNGGRISGKINLPPGFSLSDVESIGADLYDLNGNYVNSVSFVDYGSEELYRDTYTFRQVPAGRYKILINVGGGKWSGAPLPNLVSQWYGGGHSFSDPNSAEIAVSSGVEVSSIEVSLEEGSKISGVVTAPAGFESVFSNYIVIPEAYEIETGRMFRGLIANNDGSYTFTGLPTGKYKIFIRISSGLGGAEKAPLSSTSSASSEQIVVESSVSESNGFIKLIGGVWVGGTLSLSDPNTTIFTISSSAQELTGADVTLLEAVPYKNPVVKGTFKVGQHLYVETSPLPVDAYVTYQWYHIDSKKKLKAIKGATYQYYHLKSSDRGKKIVVRVQYRQFGAPTVTKTSATPKSSVASGTFVADTPVINVPAVDGLIGQTLTVSRGAWTPSASYKYQWYSNGKAIKKATKSSYKVSSSDSGKKITVRVTGSKSGYSTLNKTSAAVTVPVIAAPSVQLTGVHRVGEKLSAEIGTVPTGVTVKYQWYQIDSKKKQKAIKGATSDSYVLKSADRGKRVIVKVTYSKTRYKSVVKSSATPKSAVAYGILQDSAPTIQFPADTGLIGKTLTVSRGSWSSGVSFKYQWYSNGKAISKATKSSYKVSSTDSGKKITVRVTGSKSGYSSVNKISDPVTVPVIVVNTLELRTFDQYYNELDSAVDPLKPGYTVEPFYSVQPSSAQASFQWYQLDSKNKLSAIKGATAQSYTVKTSDVGKKLLYKITLKESGYKTISKTSPVKTITVEP